MSKERKPKPDFEELKILEVSLSGSNLIEASAGTGKTYSIALLVLRLIIEKNIGINEILLVTFTKAAVAELEDRIRKFVRSALSYAEKKTPVDKLISEIVTNAKISHQEKINRLRNAAYLLDETSICTIHSFCQQTLTEYAFETGQSFCNEVIADTRTITENEINEYWRKYITTIETDFLKTLIEHGLTKDRMLKMAMEAMSGKKYVFTKKHKGDLRKIVNEKNIEIESKKNVLLKIIKNNFKDIKEKTLNNRYACAAFSLNSPKDFLDSYLAKLSLGYTEYIEKLYPEVYPTAKSIIDLRCEIREVIIQIINENFNKAIDDTFNKINSLKEKKNIVSYDDLIGHLYKAIKSENSEMICQKLNNKYKAIFIDEFQDTDKLQFGIFEKAFLSTAIVFFIGDPKQSIYAFRKADLMTYKQAKSKVEKKYTLNKNFRSTEDYISALNIFFKPEDGFNIFKDPEILYQDVKYGSVSTKQLFYKKETVPPISILDLPNKGNIANALAIDIKNLFNSDFTISGNKVKPSDIGIIVRSNDQTKELKSLLNSIGIPAITIDDTKIFKSPVATLILNTLLAVIEPSRSSIIKALYNPYTGITLEEIQEISEENELAVFHELNIIWQSHGIYYLLMYFAKQYHLRENMLEHDIPEGKRSIANYYQISEILSKKEIEKNLGKEEIVSWLNRAINGLEIEGEEYEQRIESDEDAVRIVTVHKSKGLEYNIVFAPNLDLMPYYSKDHTFSFRDSDSGEFCFTNDFCEVYKGLCTEQSIQEYGRLIYVAITRAVCKCFIYVNWSSHYKSSTLKSLTKPIEKLKSPLFDYNKIIQLKDEEKEVEAAVDYSPLPIDKISPMNCTWQITSYSSISNTHSVFTAVKEELPEDSYDNFIFETLPKGASAGNFLHRIFEIIDFSDDRTWDDAITEAAGRYIPFQYRDEDLPFYKQLIKNVINARIKCGNNDEFSLSQVVTKHKIPELEFYYSMELFNTREYSYKYKNIIVNEPRDIEGIMHGFMDLFFEFNGKYYILDWKSNYLGNHLSHYSEQNLEEAMTASNYHLQYIIYCEAAKRFLEKRVPDFKWEKQFGGVVYMFLRGVRAESKSGIFSAMPIVS